MKRLKKYPLTTIGLLLVGITSYLLINRSPESNDQRALTLALMSCAGMAIIGANMLLTKMLDRYFSWDKYMTRRLILQLLLGLILSLAVIIIIYAVIKDLYTETAPTSGQYLLISIYGAALIIPIIAIYFGVKFLRAWQESSLRTERLEKENARSQMMSLRNHLDPHFLFNNLNILSALIDHDVDLSKEYLEKFAEVYRTILRSELSDLTLLEDELRLMEAYAYLIKIRWQDAVQVYTDVQEDDLAKALPPLSSQMLLENVIKHNTITKSRPMIISISSDGDYLTISNTKTRKHYSEKTKSGTGLLNIKNRYQHFTDQQVVVLDHEEEFAVQLPLLTIES